MPIKQHKIYPKKHIQYLTVITLIQLALIMTAQPTLLNATSIYLAQGEKIDLYQGYTLEVKGVNPQGTSAWIEIKLQNKIVKTRVLGLGENMNYTSPNGTPILNLTLNSIYQGGQDTYLARFYPVYQYQDPDLPLKTPPPQKNNNKNNKTTENTTPAVRTKTKLTFIWPILALAAIVIYLLRRL